MARVPSPRHRVSQSGFSYVEVMVATGILAIALVPAVDALQTGLAGAEIPREPGCAALPDVGEVRRGFGRAIRVAG